MTHDHNDSEHTGSRRASPARTVMRGDGRKVADEVVNAISDDELAYIFRPPEIVPRRVLIAVSGGADSIALMHLFARHVRNMGASDPLGRCEVIVATVDHGLRDGSRVDAEFVATHAKKRGFNHVTLPWLGDKPKSGIQKSARIERYRLLHECAAGCTERPAVIMLAHHQGDQAETFLMRLARGSGIDGLAAMRRETKSKVSRHSATLWRPFIDIPKPRLVATLKRDQIEWIEDPSNDNIYFERVRIRQSTSERDVLGQSDAALARSAGRIARASDALDVVATAAYFENVRTLPRLYSCAKASFVATAPNEIAIRVLSKAIAEIKNPTVDPNLAKLEELFERVRQAASSNNTSFQTTLGGCAFTIDTALFPSDAVPTPEKEPAVLIYLEPGRTNIAPVRLEPGHTATWAERFHAHLPGDAVSSLKIRALEREKLVELRKDRNALACALPAAVAATLPSFWHADQLIHVPHLEYVRPNWTEPAPKWQDEGP